MYYKIKIFILKREIIKELDYNRLCDSISTICPL